MERNDIDVLQHSTKMSAVDGKEFILQTESGEFELTLEKKIKFTPTNPSSKIHFFDDKHQPGFERITGNNDFFLGLTVHGTLYYSGRRLFAADGQQRGPIEYKAPPPGKFVDISCSKTNCAAVDSTGKLFVWGLNANNQLNVNPRHGFGPELYVTRPIQLESTIPFASVALGLQHFVGISVFGSVYTWGSNKMNQLGSGDKKHKNTKFVSLCKPLQLSFQTKAKKVVCGDYHSVILLESQDLYIIGYTGPCTNQPRDFELRLIDHSVKDVACWNGRTVYITDKGSTRPLPPNVWRWTLQHCSWVSFCGPQIHVGIKHFHGSDYQERLKTLGDTLSDELIKYGFTPLHNAVLRNNVKEVLKLINEGHDVDALDYLDLSPFDLIVQNRNKVLFDIFIQNYTKKNLEAKIGPATFLSVFFSKDNGFIDVVKNISISSVIRGLAKLLKKKEEADITSHANFRLLFDYLQRKDVIERSAEYLIYLTPLAKYLAQRKFFRWFIKLHELSNGIVSTKIFLDYLSQTIRQTEGVSETLIWRCRKFFSIEKNILDLAQTIHLVLSEFNGDMTKSVTLLAATLTSKSGREYLIKHFTLDKLIKQMLVHPHRYELLRFFLIRLTLRQEPCNVRVISGNDAEISIFQFNGKKTVASKRCKTEQMFFTEAIVTSLLHHSNIIRAIGFMVPVKNLRESLQYSAILVLPAYPAFDTIANATVVQKMNHLLQLADAVHFLHKCGIIHKDIKPENILIDNNLAKLIDFSTCHVRTHRDDNKTLADPTLHGYSPMWAGKEFDANVKYIGYASDVYSLGCLMVNLFLPADVKFEPRRFRSLSPLQIEILELRLKKKIAQHFISLVKGCVHDDDSKRLPMRNITDKLIELYRMIVDSMNHDHVLQ